MTDFFLAPALVRLRADLDKAFPKRDKTSDGWVGDPSHAARVTDHNPCWSCPPPDRGIVRAIDIDTNGPPGEVTDLLRWVMHRVIGDPRVWYAISNRRIYSATYGWKPTLYLGENPHDSHVHVSIQGANLIPPAVAYRLAHDTSPWRDRTLVPTLPVVRVHRVRDAARYPRRQVRPIAVRRVQRALTARGFPVEVDGIYGPATRRAYARYQESIGLYGAAADGIPGMVSLRRLGRGRFRAEP